MQYLFPFLQIHLFSQKLFAEVLGEEEGVAGLQVFMLVLICKNRNFLLYSSIIHLFSKIGIDWPLASYFSIIDTQH